VVAISTSLEVSDAQNHPHPPAKLSQNNNTIEWIDDCTPDISGPT